MKSRNLLLLFILIITFTACKKDTCSSCTVMLTTTSTHPTVPITSTDEIKYEELTTQGDCELSYSEYEAMIKSQMDQQIIPLNALNPYTDIDPVTFTTFEYDITMSYTISCTEE